jgi:hypothetical protein
VEISRQILTAGRVEAAVPPEYSMASSAAAAASHSTRSS